MVTQTLRENRSWNMNQPCTTARMESDRFLPYIRLDAVALNQPASFSECQAAAEHTVRGSVSLGTVESYCSVATPKNNGCDDIQTFFNVDARSFSYFVVPCVERVRVVFDYLGTERSVLVLQNRQMTHPCLCVPRFVSAQPFQTIWEKTIANPPTKLPIPALSKTLASFALVTITLVTELVTMPIMVLPSPALIEVILPWSLRLL